LIWRLFVLDLSFDVRSFFVWDLSFDLEINCLVLIRVFDLKIMSFGLEVLYLYGLEIIYQVLNISIFDFVNHVLHNIYIYIYI
jgi:hypothetical protein